MAKAIADANQHYDAAVKSTNTTIPGTNVSVPDAVWQPAAYGGGGALAAIAAYHLGKAAVNAVTGPAPAPAETNEQRLARIQADAAQHDLDVKKWQFEQLQQKAAQSSQPTQTASPQPAATTAGTTDAGLPVPTQSELPKEPPQNLLDRAAIIKQNMPPPTQSNNAAPEAVNPPAATDPATQLDSTVTKTISAAQTPPVGVTPTNSPEAALTQTPDGGVTIAKQPIVTAQPAVDTTIQSTPVESNATAGTVTGEAGGSVAPATMGRPPSEKTRASRANQQLRVEKELGNLEYRPAQTAEAISAMNAANIDPGTMNWIHNNFGPETAKFIKEAGITSDMSISDIGKLANQYRDGTIPNMERTPRVPGASAEELKNGGGSFGKTTPNWIKNQRGLSSPEFLGSLALNGLGGVQLYKAFKQGQKTGDYSDFGLGAVNQVAANVAPKAALALALMSHTDPIEPGTLPQKILDAQQAAKVGGGRGAVVPYTAKQEAANNANISDFMKSFGNYRQRK